MKHLTTIAPKELWENLISMETGMDADFSAHWKMQEVGGSARNQGYFCHGCLHSRDIAWDNPYLYGHYWQNMMAKIDSKKYIVHMSGIVITKPFLSQHCPNK